MINADHLPLRIIFHLIGTNKISKEGMKDYHHFQLSPFVSVGERKNSIEHFSIIVKWMKYYTEFCKVRLKGFHGGKKNIYTCGSYFLRKLEK